MKIQIVIILVFIFSCQHRPTNTVQSKKSDKPLENKTIEVSNDKMPVPTVTPSAQQMISQTAQKAVPNFGIIFSGGGARAWGHIGVLKEMQKYKFPIVSVAGLEWGSVVGAIYAQNLSSNEVEWEMSKFKSLSQAHDFIQAVFAKKTVADMKIPFACPSLNIKSQTVYVLNRGHVDQFLPFCLPSAGLSAPFGQSTALMTDISVVVQHLRSTGIQKIILINALGAKNGKPYAKTLESLENQMWVAAATQLSKKNSGIDEVIDINSTDFSIEDFDRRREIVVSASESSYNQIKKLAEKYGL